MHAKHKWIQGAIRKPGIFSALAKKHNMSTKAYARKMKGAKGKMGKRARLAITLMRFRKKR